MKILYTILAIISVNLSIAQSTCGTATSIGTPTSTTSCTTQSNAATSSTPCSGSGYGGNGHGITYFEFCTNAANECITFDVSNGTAGGNYTWLIYNSGCTSVQDGACMGDIATGGSFSTSEANLNPSTCYKLRIQQGTPGTFTLCATAADLPNDGCAGSLAVDTDPISTSNACATPGPTANTPTITPAMLCAGSLENTSWYTFTVLNTADVIFTLDGITCAGGAAGYQLGFFSGACGSLSSIGCTSGAGGTAAVTITGLTAGEVVTVGLDGNAGAVCDFDISASNTQPTPVEMNFWRVRQESALINSLEWQTYSETNNKEFVIQRSNDTKTWEEIKTIEGQGNSSIENNYSFDDRTFSGDVIYYRLKQTDFDGTIKYTKIVSVNNKQNASNIVVGKFDMLGRPVNADHQGVTIIVYEDGHKEKIYQVND